MGTGKRIKIEHTGYPGTNHSWRFMQQAFSEPLEGLAKLMGDKSILTGLVVDNNLVASGGFVSYKGEILPFEGGAVQDNVTLIIYTENAEFDVDVDNDGQRDSFQTYITKYLRFGTDGAESFPFSELRPLRTILETSLAPLFTQVLLNKLNGIAAGAEVNVQADWNAVSPLSDAYILNKPNVLPVLRKSSVIVGDVVGVAHVTVNFPNIGTSNYNVRGSFKGLDSTQLAGAAGQTWCTYQHTATSFELIIREISNSSQNSQFSYELLPI